MEYSVVRDDITNMNTDAIVLPANSRLREGSGASHAIYEKAGRQKLTEACSQYGNIPIGMSVPTPGFRLPANVIVHAVVPRWMDGHHNEYAYLSSAYLSALEVADKAGCETIAFPLLAAGNNGFDHKLAFEIAEKSFQSYTPTGELREAVLVLYDRKRHVSSDYKTCKDYRGWEKDRDNHEIDRHKVHDDLKDILFKFADTGFQMFKEFADDPDNRRKIIEAGLEIARIVLK